MNRTEFIEYLSLTSIGAGALPEQLKAFRRLYERNMPSGETGLLSIDDVVVSFGGDPCDNGYIVTLYDNDKVMLTVSVNHRATFRYVCTPDLPFLSSCDRFRWEIKLAGSGADNAVEDRAKDVCGCLRLVTQDGEVKTFPINRPHGQISFDEQEEDLDWPDEIG